MKGGEMTKRRMLIGVVTALVVAGCSNSSPVGPDGTGNPGASTAVQIDPTQEHGGRGFTTTLTGAAEVPGPGDPNGSGTARITVNVGQGEVCFSLSVSGIALPATGAHIHVGEVDAFGDVVVALQSPGASGTSSGCVSAAKDLLRQIVSNPAAYYVNVHSTEFPAGAIRGQLSTSPH
jgi:hypothetical protein